MNIFFTIIIVLIVFVIFGVCVYYYYYVPKYANANTYALLLLSGPIQFTETFQQFMQISALISPRQTLYIPYLGYGLSFSWQMYIPVINDNKQWQSSNNQLKSIISINDSPQIGYHPRKNYISIVVKYNDTPYLAKFTELQYKQVKCQTWVKYTVVIASNSIILYENGNIVKSKILDSVPVIYDVGNQIKLGNLNNNCLAKFKDFYMYPYPLSFNEIQTI